MKKTKMLQLCKISITCAGYPETTNSHITLLEYPEHQYSSMAYDLKGLNSTLFLSCSVGHLSYDPMLVKNSDMPEKLASSLFNQLQSCCYSLDTCLSRHNIIIFLLLSS